MFSQSGPVKRVSNAFGSSPTCPRCGKAVYFAEQVNAIGKKWHKSCLTCSACRKRLDSYTLQEHEEEPYCKSCHIRNFATPLMDEEELQQYMDDRRVLGYEPLVQPALLKSEITSSPESRRTVARGRHGAASIIAGKDDRVLVIVGPCSIHDSSQALEYARLLKSKIDNWDALHIVMRTYLTTVGWKGLINDPDIDGSFKINKGLRMARQLLCDITDLGVPVAGELLDTISPQYISDLLSWGAIGARTTESQLHRELASGVSFPIGFKNGTDGSVSIAVDAMRASSNPHAFMGVTDQGLAAIVKTSGNKDVHIILRGANKGPNYSKEFVQPAAAACLKARPERHPAIMIDCSHGNSSKNHNNQPLVLDDICQQLMDGQMSIIGVMIESHLQAGRQDVPPEGAKGLKYGVSITDACVDWATTVPMLDKLNEAVKKRREGRISSHFSQNEA
ncbi:putative phospho-2-dehydro-3-deoxyheptonate aldolase, tyrosine-inhibited [Serendipita vermifera]|nr:putative phospho-2-dehydro-3-deoxyheptonate aldolase, tyrosine-inhibited [Serendipita vermifera]